MSTKDIKNIIILGGGTAGWVAGAILSGESKGHATQVTIIDTADIPTIGVGEASIPTIYDLLSSTGIKDEELIQKCEATFKYGIQFENWHQKGAKYMHGFGNMGHDLPGKNFFSTWLSTAHYFTSRDLTPFIPTAVAAYCNKFSRGAAKPETDQHLFYPLSEISYALHFDASLLAKVLRKKALDNGAQHLKKKIIEVKTDKHGISELITEDGTRLSADLYIDCSGLTGVLSRQALKGNFENWKKYLPCDTAIAVQTKLHTEPRLYTRSVAHEAGWRWEIQLQNRTGNGIVYDSSMLSDKQAESKLLSEIEGELITQPRKIKFETGRLTQPWNKNCVAIGLSAGFLEPLESTSIHLICAYAQKIKAALNSTTPRPAEVDAFNLAWVDETNEIRDFLMAHYVTNSREEEFWKLCKHGPKPESLKNYLNEFKKSGWISLPKHALFGTDSWFEVLIGQNVDLDFKKFAATPVQAKENINFLNNVATAIQQEVNNLQYSHAETINNLSAPAKA